jgi:hypothetical protein
MNATIDVEHVNPRPGLFQCQSFFNHCRAQKVSESDTGRARPQEKVLFISQPGAHDFGGVDHACEYDSGRPLHVIVVDAVLVAVTLKQVNSVYARPILEVNATLRKHFLYGFNELVYEGIQFLTRRPCSPQTQVQHSA